MAIIKRLILTLAMLAPVDFAMAQVGAKRKFGAPALARFTEQGHSDQVN
jgi:hypothetical protein